MDELYSEMEGKVLGCGSAIFRKSERAVTKNAHECKGGPMWLNRKGIGKEGGRKGSI